MTLKLFLPEQNKPPPWRLNKDHPQETKQETLNDKWESVASRPLATATHILAEMTHMEGRERGTGRGFEAECQGVG